MIQYLIISPSAKTKKLRNGRPGYETKLMDRQTGGWKENGQTDIKTTEPGPVGYVFPLGQHIQGQKTHYCSALVGV